MATDASSVLAHSKAPTTSLTNATAFGNSNDGAILGELRSINAQLSKTSAPIWSQDFLNSLLQFFGVLAAAIFGIFAILAWTAANKSNSISADAFSLALQSNQLSLLAYCYNIQNDVRLS
jgi:hypothetical protein